MDRKEQLKQLLGNANALLEAMRYGTSTATGEAANIGHYTSYETFIRKYNDLAIEAARLTARHKPFGWFQTTRKSRA